MSQNYVKLKSGIEIPKSEVMQHAGSIYGLYSDTASAWSDLLMRLSYVANRNFDDVYTEKYLSKDQLKILDLKDFHIGPLKQRCEFSMAKTATAASMIVVNEFDGELDGYLQEPLMTGHEVLPGFYQAYILDKGQKAS